MKRSASVPLTLVTAAAGALAAACGRGADAEALNCVESASGRVVPDSLCQAAGAAKPVTTSNGADARPATGGVFPGFIGWYYGGRVINGLVRGGSYAPVAGRSYRSPTGSFLGARETRAGGAAGTAVRPSLGRANAARPSSAARPAARGGFGGIGAGRAGGG